MTCIVGVEASGSVMGADSAASDDCGGQSIRADRKLFRNGPYMIGFTDSFRMGQLLRYALKPPEPPKRGLEGFMVTKFVDAVRKCLLGGGFATKKNEAETGGTFLVGVAGRIFAVYEDYQVARNAVGYAAVGSGESCALGSLCSTVGVGARKRVRMALEAAAAHDTGVRPPFHIREMAT